MARLLPALLLFGMLPVRAAGAPEPDAAFAKQLGAEWDYAMHNDPETATWVGYPGQNDRLADLSPEAIAQRYEHARAFLAQLRSTDRAALSPANELNYDLAVRQVEERLAAEAFHPEVLAINQMSGVQQSLATLLGKQPASTEQDLRAIIARLRAIPKLVDQTIALLADGLQRGITPPRITLRDVPDQIHAQITGEMIADPLRSPMLRAFTQLPPTLDAATKAALTQAARSAYRDGVVPAFQRLGRFVTGTYVPQARTSIGLAALPHGKEWYAHNVRVATTTGLTPAEVHALGLREVQRLHGAMEAVLRGVHFAGDLTAFGRFLRTDPRFFFTDKASLVAAYRAIAKSIDPQLPVLFGRLPRLTYGVAAVPVESEKSQATGYYEAGSATAHRAGTFYANTYQLNSRPKWEMEALTLHEAVPGHHLQIALAQEQEALPDFRKFGGYDAFTEGWGLYAESLGGELGLYTDPYAKFGQLTYEMWRAVRLVVDTGIHALRWTRQQAIDFFRANTAKSDHDIVVEVDRYIVWPGQALAYKIGELKFKELRAYATAQLGARFDERAFHDEVLSLGSVPLEILDQHVRAWVAAQKRAAH